MSLVASERSSTSLSLRSPERPGDTVLVRPLACVRQQDTDGASQESTGREFWSRGSRE
jgi:hypothetical protein